MDGSGLKRASAGSSRRKRVKVKFTLLNTRLIKSMLDEIFSLTIGFGNKFENHVTIAVLWVLRGFHLKHEIKPLSKVGYKSHERLIKGRC